MFGLFSRQKKNDLVGGECKNNQDRLKDFDNIDAIARYFKTLTGISFDKQKVILKSKLITFCNKNNLNTFNECLLGIKNDFSLRQKLINELTTNESYFYREKHQLFELVKIIKVQKKKVKILCAPCSTGEEVYSIVLMLFENKVAREMFEIIGIDINSEALDKARLGIYNERSISQLPIDVLRKYFDKVNNKYHIKKIIKQCVQLKQDNVIDEGFMRNGKFDYILSRNLLIYFDAQTKKKVKNIFESMLVKPSGKVYYGHADLF